MQELAVDSRPIDDVDSGGAIVELAVGVLAVGRVPALGEDERAQEAVHGGLHRFETTWLRAGFALPG